MQHATVTIKEILEDCCMLRINSLFLFLSKRDNCSHSKLEKFKLGKIRFLECFIFPF